MASHVVVIDSAARRHTVKTTPSKHLSDVLQEACSKFGLNPDHYTLKHNNKPIDLSRTIRLSGLSSGAKLDLIQGSRSPAVVSIALQLPSETAETSTPLRLTDKFPSNTPIWQILRRFEAGAAGISTGVVSANHNFTQRATMLMSSGTTGAGRLCYEMPVVNIMGRELSSFTDLQKTLGQMGFGSGSCLLRLSYRKTEQPLEEAMADITQYFKSFEEPAASVKADTNGVNGQDPATLTSKVDPAGAEIVNDVADESAPASNPDADTLMAESSTPEVEPSSVPATDPAPISTSADASSSSQPTAELPNSVPPVTPALIIYAPPSSSTPAAAAALSTTNFDETDYIPTIAHATQHQALLLKESRNRRLPSDKELAAQASARADTLANISGVVVRLRFPDQSQVQQEYGRDSKVSALYDKCRELMQRPNGESFSLRVAAGMSAASARGSLRNGGMVELKDGPQRLIEDLGWQGRVLVTVLWGDDAGVEVRQGPSLKNEFRVKAENLKVDLSTVDDVADSKASRGSTLNQASSRTSGEGKEAKMMKFLKGLSKK